MTRRPRTFLLLLAILVAGCSTDGDRSATRLHEMDRAVPAIDGAKIAEGADAARSERRADGAGAESEGNEATMLISTAGDPTKQIRTGTMHLSTTRERMDGVGNRVVAIAEALGGSVISERSSGGSEPSVELVLGVPPEQFREAVRRVGAAAKVVSSESSVEDVTSRYADLDGRVAAMRISVERLRGFLAEASDINQIASLEGELTRREGELESTQRQLDALEARVSTSTLQVSIATHHAAPVVKEGPPSLTASIAAGWRAFTSGVMWVLAALGAAAPFLLVVVGVAELTRRWRRRRSLSAAT